MYRLFARVEPSAKAAEDHGINAMLRLGDQRAVGMPPLLIPLSEVSVTAAYKVTPHASKRREAKSLGAFSHLGYRHAPSPS